ncbi:hypothetical protein LRR18_01365 [Mangrovimonas sp. AS39]|uniref:hypothetical protein n=1 Tax=Mangrovimonas TaxID=1211036 RepID=UPI00141EC2AC|nr:MULTISPECIES: hypothetical protein [Mangrovimonas]MCF1190216.1 hypothetical protein [Mangrovimonas futianensis]MCF1194033.1 hypothetical protein [Mangrovimonas futianensis]NIK90762.1 hypothetical protein [Mangrovimonas sp. CR14]
MKNLYFILIVVFCFTIATSCSNDDGDTNPVVERTFLEQYQGTVWHIAVNEFNSEFLMFHNDESVPFEQWLLIYGQGCYENFDYKISEFNAIITENSEEYLEITFDNEHVWIIAVEENLLHWIDVSEEGVMDYIYDRQSPGVTDDLEICP